MNKVLEDKLLLGFKKKFGECYSLCNSCDVECPNNDCRYWVDCDKYKNCSIIVANDGPKTQAEVGDIIGCTGMRVCQLEKSSLKKMVKRGCKSRKDWVN
jgi:hypothetical protein